MPIPLLLRLPLFAAASLFLACASGPKMYARRIIETPTGERLIPGPVRSTTYQARVSMEHNIAHVKVFERSECPAIRVLTVERVEETLDGDKVVERIDKGAREKAETLATLIECEARFARVPIALQYKGQTYPLGTTDEYGELHTDLASRMQINTRATELSAATGTLLVADTPVNEISMAGLLQQQRRVDTIVGHLSPLLGKSSKTLSDADVTNAAMLFEELRELAPDDARTIALQRRFGEVVGGFREIQRTETLKRNLGALADAKELLATLAAAPRVPAYVHVSIASDRPTAEAVDWARAQVLLTLRRNALLCAGGFDWSRVAQLDGPERLAFSYIRYALDGDLSWLTDGCRR